MYDVVIIGAGVSGMVSGLRLLDTNCKYTLLEKGKPFDDRAYQEEEISTGFGGAGLYSDGKLSFYPSGSELWKLNPEYLSESEIFINNLLGFDSIKTQKRSEKKINNKFVQKIYKSEIIPLKRRKEIINGIEKLLREHIQYQTELLKVSKEGNEYVLEILKNDNKTQIKTRSIILATGKHGARKLETIINFIPYKFNSYEVGVRVETKSDTFDLYDSKQIDCKIKQYISDSVELRTFCCSRDGIVAKSRIDNYIYYNGNSDQISDKSNIGLNIISKDKNSVYSKEIKSLLDNTEYFEHDIVKGLDSECLLIGEQSDLILKSFIRELLPNSVEGESTIYGPSFERFGSIPIINDSLQIEGENIWLSGDNTGTFRGLYPALISGSITSKSVINYIEKVQDNVMSFLKINESSTEDIPVIFTAQSKKFFYCRDVVCEYVFNQNKLAINPFRIFDYFLSDRVERDIIRRSNNQMIKIADELWVFGPIADGVLFEIYSAKKMNKPIRFFNIATKSNEIKELSKSEIKFESEVHSKGITKNDLLDYLLEDIISENNKQLDLELF